MVYIYGGAFKTGSSSESQYAPDYLLQKDVVIVSFNYRLGAFGKFIILLKIIYYNNFVLLLLKVSLV